MNIFGRFNGLRRIVWTLALAGAGSAFASAWVGDNASGVWNLGAETQIDSSDRFVLYTGKAYVNEGAYIKVGGNSTGSCNFIGVDRSGRAELYINGGTFWASTAKSSVGGWVAVAINAYNQSAEIFVNSGLLKIDSGLRFGTYWNSDLGAGNKGGNGALTVNAGTADIASIQLGSTSASTGGSYVYLYGGLLKVGEVRQRGYGYQRFMMSGGTLQATAVNIFTKTRDSYAGYSNQQRQLEVVANTTTRFDVQSYAQKMSSQFRGTGRLLFTGTGAISFESPTTTYGIVVSNAVIDLTSAALSTTNAALTVGSTGFDLAGPVELKVTLPDEPTGCYPIVTNVVAATVLPHLADVTVTGAGEGKLILKGTSLCLDFEGTGVNNLVYSDEAGGEDTPSGSSYDALIFESTAGAFTVGGPALTLAQGIVDHATTLQTVTSAVTFATASAPISVDAGGTLALTGGLTATNPVLASAGTLVFEPTNSTVNAWTLRSGTLDFNGHTYTGTLTPWQNYHAHRAPVTLTNGTWQLHSSLVYHDFAYTLADGFTLDMTDSADRRIALGYKGNTDLQYGDGETLAQITTRLTLDGGSIFVRGNTSNVANFIGVDMAGTSELLVKAGHFCMTNTSESSYAALRIGAGDKSANTKGRVCVSGGAFDVYGDLSIATVFNGLQGAPASGTFEQTGGQSMVWFFFLGQTTSSTGTGTVSLTGGEMSTRCFNLLSCGAQSLTIDGFTLRALGDDYSTSNPLFYAFPSTDTKTKTRVLGANGMTLDSAGHTVSFGVPLTGEGAVTLTGAGTVKLICDLPAAGGFVVTTNTTLVLTGTNSVTGGIRLDAGSALQVAVAADETVTTPLAGMQVTTPTDGRVTIRVAGDVYAKGFLSTAAQANFDVTKVDVECVNAAMTASLAKDDEGRLTFTLAPKASSIWTGATSGAWMTDSNWAANLAPVLGNTLVFDEAETTTVNNDFSAETTFDALVFAKDAPDYTLTGTALTLTGTTPITMVSSNTVAVSTPVTLSGSAPTVQTWNADGTVALTKLTAGNLTKSGPGALEIGDSSAVGPIVVRDGLLKFTDAEHFTTSKITTYSTLTETPILDFGGQTVDTSHLTGTGPWGSWLVMRNGLWNLGGVALQTKTLGLSFGTNMNVSTTSRLLMGYGVDSIIRLEPGAGTVTLGGNNGSSCNFIAVDNGNSATVDVQGGLFHCSSANGSGGYLRIAVTQANKSPKGNLYISGGEVRADKEIALCSWYDGRVTGNKQNGTATMVVGGTGLVTTELLSFGVQNGDTTPTATLSVTNGGVLALGELRCYKTVNASLAFDGGTIRATKANANWLTDDAGTSHTYTIGANGLTLDTAGYAVGANLAFADASTGDLTLAGGGVFTMNDGFSLPAARTLNVSATGNLALTNGTTVAHAVAFADGASITLPSSTGSLKPTVVLTAPTITGIPTTTYINGHRRGAIYRLVEHDEVVDLKLQLTGTIVIIR